jgi:DNA-binding MarR family transcriptional regulator
MQIQQKRDALALAEVMRRECLGVRVGRLHRIVSRTFDQALRPVGLTLPQLEILTALTIFGAEVKPAVLADELVVERSTMSRNLALLKDRGLLRTITSPAGRTMAVAITPEGTALLAVARASWSEAQASLLDVLGTSAASTLDSWLSETAPHVGTGSRVEDHREAPR